MSKQMTTINKKDTSLDIRDLFIFGGLLSKKMTNNRIYSFKSLKEFGSSKIFNSIKGSSPETVVYCPEEKTAELVGVKHTTFNKDELLCFIETVELMIAMRAIKDDEDLKREDNRALILFRVSQAEEKSLFERSEVSDRITNIIYAGSTLGLDFVFLNE